MKKSLLTVCSKLQHNISNFVKRVLSKSEPRLVLFYIVLNYSAKLSDFVKWAFSKSEPKRVLFYREYMS